MRSADAPTSRSLVLLVALAGYASVALGVVQYFAGTGYVYSITNFGNGVGFFANSNHFASFMLIAIALVGGQWIHDRPAHLRLRRSAASPVNLLLRLAPFGIGLVLANSLAAGLLVWPILFGLWLLYRPDIRIAWPVALIALIAVLGGMIALLESGLFSNDLMAKSGTPGISRGEFLVNGIAMAKTFAPLGSGIGTFQQVYPSYEALAKVGTTFVNHAHDDLLELGIETGILGLAVLALFLVWLGRTFVQRWTSDRGRNPVAIAAGFAIVAVLLHSLVDYPLRTAAVSSLIAMCMVVLRREPESRGAAIEGRTDPLPRKKISI